jgi:hypothetical protein
MMVEYEDEANTENCELAKDNEICEALKNKNVKIGRLLEDTRKEVNSAKREIEGTVKKLKTKQTFMEKLISSR